MLLPFFVAHRFLFSLLPLSSFSAELLPGQVSHSPQSLLMPGTLLSQVQDFAFVTVDFQNVPCWPHLPACLGCSEGKPGHWAYCLILTFCIICKLDEGTFHNLLPDIATYYMGCVSDRSLQHPCKNLSVPYQVEKVHPTKHHSLSLIIQLVFLEFSCPSNHSVISLPEYCGWQCWKLWWRKSHIVLSCNLKIQVFCHPSILSKQSGQQELISKPWISADYVQASKTPYIFVT